MLSFSERDSLKLLEICDEKVKQLKFTFEEEAFKVSLKKWGEHKNITSLFDDIFLPVELIRIINDIESKEPEQIKSFTASAKYFKYLPEYTSITSFVTYSTGLSRAISRVESHKYLLRTTNIEVNEEIQLITINYVKSILAVLTTIRDTVRLEFFGRKDRELKDPRDFCAFCWRRIDYRAHDRYGERTKAKVSRFYCSLHHPNKEKARYNRASRALKSAVKNEFKEFSLELNDLESGEFKITQKSYIYEKWLRAFAPYISLSEKEVRVDLSWQDAANNLLNAVSSQYKYIPTPVYESVALCRDWNHWFLYGLIENLDVNGSSEERLFWQNFPLSDWNIDNWGSGGLQVAYHILHRYEAYQYIKNRKRPRGPKRNESRDLTPLKAKIKQKLISQQTSKKKLSVLEIANQIGTSPKTVYSVKKQFNL
jgi:hypothetical protein